MKRTCISAIFLALVPLALAFGGAQRASGTSASSGPVSLTLGATTIGVDNKLSDSVYMKMMEEELGVKLKFVPLDKEQLNLAMAANDLPDIVYQISNKAILQTVVNGVAVKLDSYLSTMPNITNQLYAPVADMTRKIAGGRDGGLYVLSNMIGIDLIKGSRYLGGRAFQVRWDYYKAVGAPPMNSDADYIAVLKQMQAKYPTSRSGKKTYGVGVNNNIYRLGGFRAAFTTPLHQTPWVFGAMARYTADILTNTLVNGYTDTEKSAFWTDMHFYNKLNREGLFDPDTFTMSDADFTAKILDGVYLGVYNENSSLYAQFYNEYLKSDPNTLASFVTPPSTGGVSPGHKLYPYGNNLDSFAFVPNSSKNIKKATEVLNYLWDPDLARLWTIGIKGEDWDYDASGVPYIKDARLALLANPTDAWRNTHELPPIVAYKNINHSDGYPNDLQFMEKYATSGFNPVQQDFVNYYKISYPKEAEFKLVKEGKIPDWSTDYSQLIGAFIIADIPLEIQRIMTQVEEIAVRGMPLLILAKTDAEFATVQQKLLADFKAANEPAMWTWVQERFGYYKGMFASSFENSRRALMKGVLD